jgi:hypothetical protein
MQILQNRLLTACSLFSQGVNLILFRPKASVVSIIESSVHMILYRFYFRRDKVQRREGAAYEAIWYSLGLPPLQ